MYDYGSLYLMDSNYNSQRDATEVSFGYLERDKQFKGRMMSVRVIVNVSGKPDPKGKYIDKALKKARVILMSSSKAQYEED